MKTKNNSMGTLKLKLEVTPQNIECLKSLFLKPENKTSNFIPSGTMLFDNKPNGKPVEDLPTVTTLTTKFGVLQEGDIVVSKSNDNSVYVGIVTRFTDKTIYTKNTTNIFTVKETGNMGIQCNMTHAFLIEELKGVTKNQ